MTTPAPEQPAPPAAPQSPRPDLLQRVEARLFPHGEPPALQAITGEAGTNLRGHSAALMRLGADLLEHYPGAEAAAARAFEIGLGVAKAAGIAL